MSNLKDLLQAAVDRAAADDSFLAALRLDPEAALREALGVTVVPGDPLSEAELDDVVGGVGVSLGVMTERAQQAQLATGTLMGRQRETLELVSAYLKRAEAKGASINFNLH